MTYNPEAMNVRQENIVSLEDFRRISIDCPHCHTVVILDMESVTDKTMQRSFTPKECPACQKDYDSAIRPNVDAFQKAFAALKPIAARIAFRS